MPLDVIDLREFYARPLGAVTRRLIGKHIRERWQDVNGMSVFGLGYATPYLAVFRGEAVRVGALKPACRRHGTRHGARACAVAAEIGAAVGVEADAAGAGDVTGEKAARRLVPGCGVTRILVPSVV